MNNQWVRFLAHVSGLVSQELRLQNEYLVAENHILKAHLRPGFRLTDSERATLAQIGKRLGRKALQKGWGYDRIVGALANLGYPLSDQTVGNILRRHGIPPASKRSQTTTWKEFARRHMDVLPGADFLIEVLTWRGLVTYYVLFFLYLKSRRITLAGITAHPDQNWMLQIARNATIEHWVICTPTIRFYTIETRSSALCYAAL